MTASRTFRGSGQVEVSATADLLELRVQHGAALLDRPTALELAAWLVARFVPVSEGEHASCVPIVDSNEAIENVQRERNEARVEAETLDELLRDIMSSVQVHETASTDIREWGCFRRARAHLLKTPSPPEVAHEHWCESQARECNCGAVRS